MRIYTDGSCIGNPGPGGWAYIIQDGGTEVVGSGGADLATNNQMEMQAVIEALRVVNKGTSLALYSDSQYIVKGIMCWMHKWEKKGWKKSGGELKNVELWQEIYRLVKRNHVKAYHVRGHSGHPENERCDAMAFKESKSRQK